MSSNTTPQDDYHDNLSEFWSRSLRQRSVGVAPSTNADKEDGIKRETISQLKKRKRGSKSFELDKRRHHPSRFTSDQTTQEATHRTVRSTVIGKSADSKIDASQDDVTADIKSLGRATFTNFHDNS